MFEDTLVSQKAKTTEFERKLSNIPGIEIGKRPHEEGGMENTYRLSEGANGNREIVITVSEQANFASIAYRDSEDRLFQTTTIFSKPETIVELAEEVTGYSLQSTQNDSQGTLSVDGIDLDQVRKEERWWE